MIIFTPIKDLPNEILEYKGIERVIKYNLSSYVADVSKLDMLIPSPEFISEDVLHGDCTDASFDIAYHGYILQNDYAFLQLMSIMIPEFTEIGVLIQILINVSDYRDIISESLMKLIQQRYGHNCFYVYNPEDLIYIETQDFSVPGLFALDSDIARWRIMNSASLGGEFYE